MFRSLFLIVTVLLSGFAEGAPLLQLIDEEYKSGLQLFDEKRDDPVVKMIYTENVQSGFVEVPLDYLNPASAKTFIHFLLPQKFDSKKPSVLFFMGGPGSPSSLALLSHIDQKIPEFNWIFFDARGTGFSKPPTFTDLNNVNYFSSEFTARDAKAVLDHLGVQKASIWGTSYGTVPATIFASQFGSQTVALVLEGVIFSGDVNLWADPHRQKILQRFFDRQPLKIQDGILKFSAPTSRAPTWYSNWLQKIMYQGNFKVKAQETLNSIFDGSKTDEQIQSAIVALNLFSKSQMYTETLFQNVYQFHQIACQELSAGVPGGSFNFEFEGRKLVPTKDSFLESCLEIPNMHSNMNRTYYAEKYPVSVPVTYFQGAEDGATGAPNAVRHFKSVAKGQKQIVIATNEGHTPIWSSIHVNTPQDSDKAKWTILSKALLGMRLEKSTLIPVQTASSKWVIKGSGQRLP